MLCRRPSRVWAHSCIVGYALILPTSVPGALSTRYRRTTICREVRRRRVMIRDGRRRASSMARRGRRSERSLSRRVRSDWEVLADQSALLASFAGFFPSLVIGRVCVDGCRYTLPKSLLLVNSYNGDMTAYSYFPATTIGACNRSALLTFVEMRRSRRLPGLGVADRERREHPTCRKYSE